MPLPDSDAASDSSSDSGSDPPDSSDSGKIFKKPLPKVSAKQSEDKNGSDTSVTLDKTSPEFFPVTTFAPLPPDPSTRANNRGRKNAASNDDTPSQPFSRIRKDIQVDPRLASNAYNAHGWGRQAHEDLVVTKGKDFTKEKNKKKKGSYRGGFIDTSARNGIKFE